MLRRLGTNGYLPRCYIDGSTKDTSIGSYSNNKDNGEVTVKSEVANASRNTRVECVVESLEHTQDKPYSVSLMAGAKSSFFTHQFRLLTLASGLPRLHIYIHCAYV